MPTLAEIRAKLAPTQTPNEIDQILPILEEDGCSPEMLQDRLDTIRACIELERVDPTAVKEAFFELGKLLKRAPDLTAQIPESELGEVVFKGLALIRNKAIITTKPKKGGKGTGLRKNSDGQLDVEI